MSSESRQPRDERELGVLEPRVEPKVRPQTDKRLKRPPLYKVLLHNDDFTPMEFVVEILKSVFQHSESEAMAIMLHAHTQGMAVAGVYAHEIAESKAEKVRSLAEEAELPLLCTLEPEDSGSEGDER